MSVLPDLPADRYHADELMGATEGPTLSASIAKILIAQSPLHAYTAHPRLNPYYKREEEDRFSIGTVAHAVLLEGRDVVEVIEADSWRTNDAKAARDLARENGKVPLLGKDYFDVMAMVDAARRQLDAHEASPALFTAGKPEQTITWDEDGVACRSRIDWLHDDYRHLDDLKSTGRSASPHDFARTLYGVGNDVSAAFYIRGVRAVTGITPIFRWCVIETAPPFALSVVTPGPDVLAVADDKVTYAINLWRECLANDSWPGYSNRVATAELPGYIEAQWMERSAA